MAKLLLIVGGVLIALGVVLLFAKHIPLIGKLPGDIFIERGRFSFYFPIVTCILISGILTVVLTLVTRFLH